ncbi:MAG: hypothetical protein QGD90_04285 [Candidatus Hydrogenedentes bacterium]|nr:hypothetical protein [Candidatus Hydrogenedentota bacterium]
MAYYGGSPGGPSGHSGRRETAGYSLQSKVAELERKLQRVELEHRVLWELVRDGLKLTEEDLEGRMRDVDLRDGVEDGKISNVPLRCPRCKRISSSKHWKCQYCGQDFEKYVY